MRLLLILPLLLSAYTTCAQRIIMQPNPYLRKANTRGERLYYVPATGTVETRSGQVVLRPGMGMLAGETDVPEIELPSTFFDLIDTSARRQSDGMHFFYSICTFNTQGQLLYHPYWFDNGPDYWVEGRRRFIEGGKMGLVDRLGRRIVPARDFTFISPLRGGYALGCRDCRYVVFDSTDNEHGSGYDGSRYAVLDAAGNILQELVTDNPDQSLDSLALKRRYKNPTAVKRLQRILMALPETDGATVSLSFSKASCAYRCYDEPGPGSPWYHFGLEDTTGMDVGPLVQFLISADGRDILHISRGLDYLTPYELWRAQPEKTY